MKLELSAKRMNSFLYNNLFYCKNILMVRQAYRYKNSIHV